MNPLSPLISAHPLLPYPRQSRIHRLHSFSTPQCSCYVKRDDELGFGISGSKLRKYLSLMPQLLDKRPQQVVVMGGGFSNHVLSISQLLRESQIEPVLFLLGNPGEQPLRGNLLWTSLFASQEHIHWIPRGNWDRIDSLAKDYQTLKEKEGIRVEIIPKGANCREALPGALTLAEDILRNEKEMNITFDHLIVDAGMGMIASALVLAFAYLKKSCHVHVILIAQSDADFHKTLQARYQDWETLFGLSPSPPLLYTTYPPQNAPSFGSTNARVFQTVARVARHEGFLTDPIFTAKLFDEGERLIADKQLQGNILFIHSGGGLSLAGFQEQIERVAKLLCPEKSMILGPFASGSNAATTHSTRPTPSGLGEENGRIWPQKGDFNG